MRDELAALKDVAQRLEAAGFVYMVSGSVAMSFYAQPRDSDYLERWAGDLGVLSLLEEVRS